MKIKILYVILILQFCFQINGFAATTATIPPIKMYADSSMVADSNFVQTKQEVIELLRKCTVESRIAVGSLVFMMLFSIFGILLLFVWESAAIAVLFLSPISFLVGVVASITSFLKWRKIKELIKEFPMLKEDPDIAKPLQSTKIRIVVLGILFGSILLGNLISIIGSLASENTALSIGSLGLSLFLLLDNLVFKTKK